MYVCLRVCFLELPARQSVAAPAAGTQTDRRTETTDSHMHSLAEGEEFWLLNTERSVELEQDSRCCCSCCCNTIHMDSYNFRVMQTIQIIQTKSTINPCGKPFFSFVDNLGPTTLSFWSAMFNLPKIPFLTKISQFSQDSRLLDKLFSLIISNFQASLFPLSMNKMSQWKVFV